MAARWIVLTPSLDDDAWLSALRAAGAEAGLTVIQAHPDHPEWLMQDSGTVVIANMPAIARDAGARVETVITPRPETAPERCAQLFGLEPPQTLWVASQIVAEAVSLDDSRLIDATALATSTGPIEVLPGLALTPPGVERQDVAVRAEPMSLFRGGRPSDGATTQWAPTLFAFDETAARRGGQAGSLDVTGRPRLLVYGPYFCLTPGNWRQTARFSLDEAAARHRFRLDWGTQTSWTSHEIINVKPGRYEIELEHRWSAPAPAEFRILLMEGAFAGQLEFDGGVAKLMGGASAPRFSAAA